MKKGNQSARKVKFVVKILNVVLMLYGMTSSGIAIWIRFDDITKDLGPNLDYSSWQAGSDVTHSQIRYLRLLTLFAAVFGFVTIMCCIIAFWGMVYYNARCYGTVYGITLIVGIILTAFLFINDFPEHWRDTTTSTLEAKFDAEYLNADLLPNVTYSHNFTETFDKIQKNEGCCGLNGYEDYDSIISRLPNGTLVPPSCVSEVDLKYTATSGCLTILLDRTDKYYYLLMAVTVFGLSVELTIFGFVILLCTNKRSSFN